MKFIRNWFKTLIKEAISENFPSINISIQEKKDQQANLTIINGIFRNSKIQMSKNEFVDLRRCDIEIPKDGSFVTMEDVKPLYNDKT